MKECSLVTDHNSFNRVTVVVLSFIMSHALQRAALTFSRDNMNRLSLIMACNLTRGFCENTFVFELWLAHRDSHSGLF